MSLEEFIPLKIGYRTIKTAIGAPISMSLAQLFGVTHVASAGILTILCIQPSRKRSVLSAWDRFAACMLAIVFSYVFFETIGYNTIAIGLMLLLFIPVTVHFNINQGLVTSIVIILNIFVSQTVSLHFIVEQVLIIVVGVRVGLLLNLYMPNLERRLRVLQIRLENNFKIILHEIALYIRDNDIEWDQEELIECEKILERAGELGELDKENHLWRENHPYAEYFHMRERQFVLLQSMLPLVSALPKQAEISEKIASFFERLSLSVHPGNTADLFLAELAEIKKSFHQEGLPTTQDEFETRANLFRLLHEIEEYLILKSKFKQSDLDKVRFKKRTGG